MENEKIKIGLFDTDERLNHNSWTNGGTHITNFSLEQLKSYVEAVKLYKQVEPNRQLIISGFAYNSSGNGISGYSLHQIGEGGDLSEFWRVKEDVDRHYL